jgi:glycosyltransferase involved in cell wall biosynthesis
MKISVITVCYNSAKTIEKTFQSVQNQTYVDIEYIIIDGGSKDGTLELAKKYDTIVDTLVSQPDKGLYDAMNKGIQLATGDLVGILNSDDVFTNSHVLENIANFHIKNSVDASVGNIVQFNEEGKIVRKYSAKNWRPEKLKIGFMPPHPAVFFKRNLFKKFGYYHLDFKIAADYELITRFFLKQNISWKYSNITTTSMLIGGLSSSGFNSYKVISKEIKRALTQNNIRFNQMFINFRAIWKILELFKL